MRWMTAFRLFCLLALLSQAIPTLPATATIYLSNPGTLNSGGYGIGTNWIAQSFETGTNSSGYILNSITLPMSGTDGSPTGFALSVFSKKGVFPGSSLEVLAGSSDPSVYNEQYTYTSTGLLLQPSTIYWIVASAVTPYYYWSYTRSQDYGSCGRVGFHDTVGKQPRHVQIRSNITGNLELRHDLRDRVISILDATAVKPEPSIRRVGTATGTSGCLGFYELATEH